MSDLEKIKQLRLSTGAGFKDCGSALKDSKGNLDKAIEILRIKGISKASKKMSRIAKEGVIVVSGDNKKISVLEVNCETDFVAKNNDFINFVKELGIINNSVNSNVEKLNNSLMKNKKNVADNLVDMIAKIGEKITLGRAKTLSHDNSKNYFYLHTIVKDNLSKLAVIISINSSEELEKIDLFGKQISMHIAASNPISVDIDGISQEIIEKEQQLIAEELVNSGKNEDIAKKISIGKINKFKEESSLMTQQWVMEPKKKVQDIIKELAIKDLKIIEFYRIKIGD